jgi:hypothetical protein
VLVDALMGFALAASEPYRKLCQERGADVDEEAWQELVDETPGKPDHAALVGYCVGAGPDRRRSIQR